MISYYHGKENKSNQTIKDDLAQLHFTDEETQIQKSTMYTKTTKSIITLLFQKSLFSIFLLQPFPLFLKTTFYITLGGVLHHPCLIFTATLCPVIQYNLKQSSIDYLNITVLCLQDFLKTTWP